MKIICPKCKENAELTMDFTSVTCDSCGLDMSYGEYIKFVAHNEEKYSDIFETTVIKKTRKEDITTFVNLYVNSKGNILSEYVINAKKSVEIIEKEKEKILIEDINNQFNQFEDFINNAYKDDECNLINLLNV